MAEQSETKRVPVICATCHWWHKNDDRKGGHHLCVLHTGLMGSNVRKVVYRKAHPFLTSADFGCNQWEKDRRVKPQPQVQQEVQHCCGLQGFGAPGDTCPACEKASADFAQKQKEEKTDNG